MDSGIPILEMEAVVIEASELDGILRALRDKGFQCLGPTVRDGAIIYDEIQKTTDLPIGFTDEQEAGTYRLKRRNDPAFFGYAVGPHSWKKYLHPPRQKIWSAQKNGKEIELHPEIVPPTKQAFIGVRACELNAITILDKVFLGGVPSDGSYRLRRENIFVLAVQCGQPAKTCFCVSMNTGPKVQSNFDMALTELIDSSGHRFLVELGTPLGREILGTVDSHHATDRDKNQAETVIENTKRHMGRTLDTVGIKEILYQNLEHPQWDKVAQRCLTCANCTLVCPTCFCSTVEDTTDLKGDNAERWQRWDSCFTLDFSYLHGGSVRNSTKSRYRQWLTHKLGTWIDQFGSSGCVGCGRCISWCPVGIDLTQEMNAIRECGKGSS